MARSMGYARCRFQDAVVTTAATNALAHHPISPHGPLLLAAQVAAQSFIHCTESLDGFSEQEGSPVKELLIEVDLRTMGTEDGFEGLLVVGRPSRHESDGVMREVIPDFSDLIKCLNQVCRHGALECGNSCFELTQKGNLK